MTHTTTAGGGTGGGRPSETGLSRVDVGRPFRRGTVTTEVKVVVNFVGVFFYTWKKVEIMTVFFCVVVSFVYRWLESYRSCSYRDGRRGGGGSSYSYTQRGPESFISGKNLLITPCCFSSVFSL